MFNLVLLDQIQMTRLDTTGNRIEEIIDLVKFEVMKLNNNDNIGHK